MIIPALLLNPPSLLVRVADALRQRGILPKKVIPTYRVLQFPKRAA